MLFQLDHFPEFKRWKLEKKHMKKTPFFFRSYPYPSSHVMVQWKMNLLLKETFFFWEATSSIPMIMGRKSMYMYVLSLESRRICLKNPTGFLCPKSFPASNPWPFSHIDPKEDPLKETYSHGIHGTGIFYLLTYLSTWMVHVLNIYLHEWLILMVHGGKYTIHGSYGPGKTT